MTHPIETESYRIMEAELGPRLDRWPPPERAVVARMVHATADADFAATALIGERAVAAAVEALERDAPLICDAAMVASGLTGRQGRCYLHRVPVAPPGGTRAAAAIDLAATDHPDGALWVFGNAPTALRRLLELHLDGRLRPAAVIGLPVGYVGAAEAKAELWASPLGPVAITNTGRRGGSPVAAAAVNALLRLARR